MAQPAGLLKRIILPFISSKDPLSGLAIIMLSSRDPSPPSLSASASLKSSALKHAIAASPSKIASYSHAPVFGVKQTVCQFLNSSKFSYPTSMAAAMEDGHVNSSPLDLISVIYPLSITAILSVSL